MLTATFTSAAVLVGPDVASAAVGLPTGSGAAGAGPGSVLWTSVHAGDGHAVAADPKGGMVFVAGSAGLIAHDAGTGAQLWDDSAGAGRSAAVTPDGHIVFVIKPLRTGGGGSDFLTSAFDAATGNRVWARRYSGCPKVGCVDVPTAVTVSPSGGAVFVTGKSWGGATNFDFATIAYAAATGARLWVRRHGHAQPTAVLVSPLGGTVLFAGTTCCSRRGTDDLFVAYSAVTGRTKRVSFFGVDDFVREFVDAAAISPDGRSLYLTGAGVEVPGGPAQAFTVAANIATGAVSEWQVTAAIQVGRSVAVSPDGGTVYVVVETLGGTTGSSPLDFTTTAFRA